MDKAKLEELAPILLKLTSNENLTLEESRKAFNLTGDYDETGLFFTALVTGLMAKGPTVDEILGFCLDRKDRIGSLKVSVSPENAIDLSGGGGDKIKSVNVSTLAAFVCAAGGLTVAKQAATAFTGYLGSSDILNELGIGIPTDTIDEKRIKTALETTNFVAYNYASLAPKRFVNYLRWRKLVVESGLKIFIPQHIASFAYSPIQMGNRIYGLASSKYMRLLAEVLQRLGHKNVLVVHGVDGLDEISNVGTTKVVEVRGSAIKEYELTPQNFGVEKVKVADIKIENKEESKKQFLEVLRGEGKRDIQDLVAITAGAAFYLTGKRKSYKEGTKFALELLKSGKVGEKLLEVVAFYKQNRG